MGDDCDDGDDGDDGDDCDDCDDEADSDVLEDDLGLGLSLKEQHGARILVSV